MHCRDLFRSSKILTLPSLYILNCIILTLSLQEDKAFLNNRDTRNNKTIILPQHRLALFENDVFYCGAKFYNVLPRAMREGSLRALNKDLKALLLDKAYYDVEEFLEDCSLISRGLPGLALM